MVAVCLGKAFGLPEQRLCVVVERPGLEEYLHGRHGRGGGGGGREGVRRMAGGQWASTEEEVTWREERGRWRREGKGGAM